MSIKVTGGYRSLTGIHNPSWSYFKYIVLPQVKSRRCPFSHSQVQSYGLLYFMCRMILIGTIQGLVQYYNQYCKPHTVLSHSMCKHCKYCHYCLYKNTGKM
jgi:hypothetical protein